jgi:hypothetical protein
MNYGRAVFFAPVVLPCVLRTLRFSFMWFHRSRCSRCSAPSMEGRIARMMKSMRASVAPRNV